MASTAKATAVRRSDSWARCCVKLEAFQPDNAWHNRAAAVDAPLEKRATGGSAFMPLLSAVFVIAVYATNIIRRRSCINQQCRQRIRDEMCFV
ncbi:hypothetical protein SAMN06265222_1582 [Neorhodopirellula lusitana]|uniref:Uncharacterized protein n=1 Tax=Neorhodopirellula lusitana TaxID=445327 RepID=A0ABY1QXB4_9BACT|nr:hypothetical protein SAMN06265222_1582 [Neorhodopirellula lusitana]